MEGHFDQDLFSVILVKSAVSILVRPLAINHSTYAATKMEGQRYPLKTVGSPAAVLFALFVCAIGSFVLPAVAPLFSVSELFISIVAITCFLVGIVIAAQLLNSLRDNSSWAMLIEPDRLTFTSRSEKFSFPLGEIVSIDWYCQYGTVVVKTENETGNIPISDFQDPIEVIEALRMDLPLEKQKCWEEFVSRNLSLAGASYIAPVDDDETRDFICMQREVRAHKRWSIAVMCLIYGCLFLAGSLLLIDFRATTVDMLMLPFLWLFFVGVFFPGFYLLNMLILSPSRYYPKIIPVGPRGKIAPDGLRYFVTIDEIYPRSMADRQRLATLLRSYLARETSRAEFFHSMMDFKMEKLDATVRNIHAVTLSTLGGSFPLDAGQGLRQMLQRALLMLDHPRYLAGCLLQPKTDRTRLSMNVTLGCCCLLSFGWVFVGWWFVFVGLWFITTIYMIYQLFRRHERSIVSEKMIEVIPFFPYEDGQSFQQAIEVNPQLYAAIESLGGEVDGETSEDSAEPLNINPVPLNVTNLFFWLVMSPISIFWLNTDLIILNGIRVTEKGIVVGEIV